MKTNNNKNVIVASVAALTLASVAAVAGIISKNLKRNLIRDLNDAEFENYNGYGKCCSPNCCSHDSYDDVLRYRKNRYYQKVRP